MIQRWIPAAVSLVTLLSPCTVSAAESLLVGAADLAVKPAIAEQLELDEQQLDAIWQLIDRREKAGFETVMRLKDLSADERREQLRPFRLESQRQLAAILTDDQIETLDALRDANIDPNYEPLLAEEQGVGSKEQGESTGEPEASAPGVEPEAESDESPNSVSSDRASEAVMEQGAESREQGEQVSREAVVSGVESSEGEAPAEQADQPEPPTSSPEPKTPGADAAGLADPPAPDAASATTLPDDGKLLFNFRYQPWQDVLDWFAEQNDLSLLLESPPSGTFNYTDSKRYTPSEALDILNSVLLTKGYTLVRRERMLVLVNLEDGVPPNLVADVPLSELDERGEYELVRVLFKLRNMTPAVAAEEVQRLVGPQGSVVLLPRAGMIQVTETAGRVRAIREVIQAVEQPANLDGGVTPFALKYIMSEDALPVLRQMLDIDDDDMSSDDGTLQLAIDSLTGKVLASGTPEKLARLRDVLALIDVPEAAAMSGSVAESLQLEVYSTAGSDPESVLAVLQTLLAETPGVRITSDPFTGNIVALATAADQATIRVTIKQMGADARQIEAIPLYTVDPSLAVLAINKLFGVDPMAEKPDPRAPIVDADLTSSTLFVRASPSQIEQIQTLLSKMGEDPNAQESFALTQQGNVRTLTLSGTAALTALEQVEKLWPMMRQNPFRVVIPSKGIQSYRPSDGGRRNGGEQSSTTGPRPVEPAIDFGFEEFSRQYFEQSETPAAQPNREPTSEDPSAGLKPTIPGDRSANDAPRVTATLAVMQQAADDRSSTDSNADAEIAELAEMAAANSEGEVRNKPGAPIVAAPGPGGTIIASEDLDALDALEQMLSITAGSSYGTTREYAVFYLKFAKAPAAAETLSKMFGGGGASSSGGGLMSGIAGAALGDLGGGLMGDLLGLGGSSSVTGFSAGSVDIVADTRLNLLLVYAQPQDIETVNQVLEILDQNEGPEEVEAQGKPRLIPVYNTTAEGIATVVKSVYSDRIEGAGGGNQPSPQDIIKALGRGQGGGGGETQEPEKMTIGVDERSNSLVVRASDPLFQQVEALVRELDEQQRDSSKSTKIVSVKNANIDAVKQALQGVFGSDAITTSSSNTSSRSSTNNNNSSSSSSNNPEDTRRALEDTQRRIEFMRQLQERMQQGGGGIPGGGRGGPPGLAPGGGRDGPSTERRRGGR